VLVGNIKFICPVGDSGIGHYVSYVYFPESDECMLYNDYENGGVLQPQKSLDKLLLPDPDTSLVMYRLVTKNNVCVF
jgi:hypothetical protein